MENEEIRFAMGFYKWFFNLDQDNQTQIKNEAIERYYPDGFNGFAQDVENDTIRMGEGPSKGD